MNVILLLLALGSLWSAEQEAFFSRTVREGLSEIRADHIPQSMKLIRKAINCQGLEGAPYNADLARDIAEAAAQETAPRRRAALLVYQAVVGLTRPKPQYDAIMAALHAAESADGTLPEIFNTRAALLMRQRHYDQALTDLHKALALNPRYVDAWANRAMVHRALGNTSAAVEDFARYQDLLNTLYDPPAVDVPTPKTLTAPENQGGR